VSPDRGLVDDRHRRVSSRQAAVDQRARAGTRNPSYGDEHAQRDVDRDILEVVKLCVPDWDRAMRHSRLRLQLLSNVEVAARG
jgi:hypothetical protein